MLISCPRPRLNEAACPFTLPHAYSPPSRLQRSCTPHMLLPAHPPAATAHPLAALMLATRCVTNYAFIVSSVYRATEKPALSLVPLFPLSCYHVLARPIITPVSRPRTALPSTYIRLCLEPSSRRQLTTQLMVFIKFTHPFIRPTHSPPSPCLVSSSHPPRLLVTI